MHHHTTWYEGRPRSRRQCVRSPPPQKKGATAHVYCGETVAHFSYCEALVLYLLTNTADYCCSQFIIKQITCFCCAFILISFML